MTITRRAVALHLTAALFVTSSLAPLAAADRGALTVTVHYKGAGTVDANHRIWIWVFDTPDIGPNAMPVREESLAANGGSIAIEGLGEDRVWLAVGYDERGGSAGNAPPAPGSPIGIHGMGANGPTPVTTADAPTVVVTFDDTIRMP